MRLNNSSIVHTVTYGIHNFEPAVSTSLYHLYIMPGLGQYTYARSYYNSHRSCNDYGVAYSGGTCYHGGGYSGGSSYYGGGGYYDGSEVDCRDLPCWGTRCCRIFVVIVFAFLAAIIITSVIVLPVTLTTRSPGSGNNLEGTRMVSFSNFFCSGIGIRAASSSVTLIEKTPPLIRNVGVTRHNVRYSGRIAVKTWQSYLLPNSNVTVFVRNARSPVPVSGPVSQRIRSPRKSDPGRIRYASGFDPTPADSIRGINGAVRFLLSTSHSER